MAQTINLVFNGGSIPSPAPAPTGSGKAKLLKIGEITITEQGVQVAKKVICDPDSVTTVAPFMEVLTSAKLAELVKANSIIVLDDGDMQYLMANANITVEEGISVCTAVNFLGLSKKKNKAKVAYNCIRITDEHTLQQVVEVGEPVETNYKIHRYSFGDGTVGGETPVYGSWLIDLDKPDPNGPEGYARVTPAEFWRSTAVNGELPVFLQDKDVNNSLTYAYLSRADVTKSGSTVTDVFAFFVRSGYGNDLASSVGFRIAKLNGSNYLQKASLQDDWFDARSLAGITMTYQSGQSVDHKVSSSEAGSGKIRIPLSHFDKGVYLLDVQLYARGPSSHFGSDYVPLRVSFRYSFGSRDACTIEHTGALEQLDQNGPWYYGSTIQLNTDLPGLTGVDVEFYFGTNKLVENDIIGVTISYTLLSKQS